MPEPSIALPLAEASGLASLPFLSLLSERMHWLGRTVPKPPSVPRSRLCVRNAPSDTSDSAGETHFGAAIAFPRRRLTDAVGHILDGKLTRCAARWQWGYHPHSRQASNAGDVL